MERVIAIKRLSKMLGKNIGYRIDPSAPTPEDRETARAALPAVIAKRQQAEGAMKNRRNAILEADEELQALTRDWQQAKDAADRLFSISRHYKFTVGVSNRLFFHVKAEGDSWEDVISKLGEKTA